MLNRREFLASIAVSALPPTTSLKATGIDHISYQSVDYKKTRDFYIDLLGFQVSDEDQQQLFLWAGDMIISAKNTPRVTTAYMDHWGFTVQPWNANAIAGVLKERGLTGNVSRGQDPHDPAGKSIFTRDANGYPTQLCAPDLETRPAQVASRSPLKAIGLHHISYLCSDYRKPRDFYKDLLGARVTNDDGQSAYLWFADAYIVVRNNAAAVARPVVDHVAWILADWNKDKVTAELRRRALEVKLNPAGQSILTKDLNGYPLELCSKAARPL